MEAHEGHQEIIARGRPDQFEHQSWKCPWNKWVLG